MANNRQGEPHEKNAIVRIESETIKEIDEIANLTLRTKSNVIEYAILRYYDYVQEMEAMARRYEIEQSRKQKTAE